jgi:hypothetical protein
VGKRNDRLVLAASEDVQIQIHVPRHLGLAMLGNAIKVGYDLEQSFVNLLVQVTTKMIVSHAKTPKQFESG